MDVPSELFDPAKGHQIYNEYLDELEYAAQMGFDGICVNEHHQNAYGLMPSPNLMAAALARRTKDVGDRRAGQQHRAVQPADARRRRVRHARRDVGRPARRGLPGRHVDGHELLLRPDPVELREKYREAHDLIMRAWTEPEPFAFNGKYTQLRYVNTWPGRSRSRTRRSGSPGGGSIETWEWVVEQDYLFAYLSYGGYKRAQTVMDTFWKYVEEAGKDDNPYRAGFLQFVAVSETDAQAERDYAEHADYFFQRCMHVYPGFAEAPGYRSLRTVKAGLKSQFERQVVAAASGQLKWKNFMEDGYIIGGSPEDGH